MYKYGITSAGNAINLRRLIALRLIVIAVEAIAILYGINYLHLVLPLTPLVVVLIAFMLISLLTLARLYLARPVSNIELFLHLSLDVLVLTILLYYTGGSTNPFAPLYLIPLTLTAATLPARYTWGMVVLTVVCYSLLLFNYVDLPQMHGSHDHGFRLHVLGMWLGFILSALLIAGFVVRMASTVRKQDKKITTLREQQLKHEQVLALGTLAAGAAHELGTPLSTMAIMLKDMEPHTAVSQEELDTLRDQVNRCRDILGSISATAGTTRAESGSNVKLDSHLQKLIDAWTTSRPDVSATIDLNGTQPAPRIVADQTLDQALINIFNNAADASPQEVEISAHWTDENLTVEVADRGSGLSAEVINKPGDKIYSTKQDGLGLGLFLTYTTLERIGGTVHLLNRESGGVLCCVNLPLNNILISE
jgi:two-component system sensor histidine kinase RegB